MPPERGRLKNVLDDLRTIEGYLSKRKRVNLFLDFDGTLAPIAASPDEVMVPNEVVSILRKICEFDNVFVAVITGRSMDQVRELLNIRKIHYAGNHGLEISGVRRTEIVPNAAQVVRSIKKVSEDLNKVLLTVPGAWVENKSLTATVHYRTVPPSHVPELNRLVGEITANFIDRGIVRLTRGKKVIEIQPNVNWDKGKAVKWMLRNIAMKRATTFYIGDDRTDENAFEVLDSSVTIKVVRDVRARTAARYILNNPTEVRFFLQWLLDRGIIN
jgi:trehalose 6-phosphate phosphatase